MRLSQADRDALVEMGFRHAVMIAQDVSVHMAGSVVSVFTHGMDALAEAERLSRIYNVEHSFVEVAIGDRSPTGPGRATGPVHESPGAAGNRPRKAA